MPITLNYHGGGIKINDIATWVGLGWHLSAGGGITVSAKGLYDFTKRRIDIRTKEDLQALNLPETWQLAALANRSFDAEPDVYNYNFCGFSGQFVFDENFNVHFLKNNGGLKIECIRTLIPGQFGGHWEATFRITDLNGIKYFFEVFETTKRYDFKRGYCWVPPTWYGSLWHSDGVNTQLDEIEATNWMLTKIELENQKDSICFNYHTEEVKYQSGLSGVVHATNKESPDRVQRDFEWLCSNEVFSYSEVHNFVPVLESVYYSRDSSKIIFKTEINRQDIHSADALSEIEIWNSTQRVLVWSFNYDNYFISDFSIGNDVLGNPLDRRLKLNSITKKSGDKSFSEPPYVFIYFGDDTGEPKLPPRNSYDGFDHWGYSNRIISYDDSRNPFRLFPKVTYNDAHDLDFICIHSACNGVHNPDTCFGGQVNAVHDFEGYYNSFTAIPLFEGGHRNPNDTFAKSYSLKEIKYPTGGYSFFDYESNTYSSCFSGTHTGSSGENTCGGIRIKSIADGSNGHFATNIRTFEYQTGVLFGEPMYIQPTFLITYESSSFFDCGNDFGMLPKIGGWNLYSHTIEPVSLFGADNIGYSEVTETSDKGVTVYSYYSGTDFSNSYNYYYAHKQYGITNNMFYSSIFDGNRLIYPLSLDYTTGELTGQSYKRGLPKEIRYYTADNSTLVKKDSFEYDFSDGDSVVGNRVAALEDHYFINAYYLRTGKSFLKCKKTQFYNSGNTNFLETIDSGTYNLNYEQLTESEIINSIGESRKTNYLFPNHIYSGGIHGCTPEACGLNQLYTNHRLSTPLEILFKNDNQLIESRLTTYKTQDNTTTGFAVPYHEYAIESSVPFTKENTEITYNSGNGLYELSYDSKYKLKVEYECDEYGNVISILRTDDIPVSYYYGYSKLYQVIEAKNADFANLQSAVNSTVSDFETFLKETIGNMTSDAQKAAWREFNNNLRSNSNLSDALVTTYTYLPLVGITSVTDPAGFATYFEYDALCRLVIIKDNNGKIIQQYKYHYAGQNGTP